MSMEKSDNIKAYKSVIENNSGLDECPSGFAGGSTLLFSPMATGEDISGNLGDTLSQMPSFMLSKVYNFAPQDPYHYYSDSLFGSNDTQGNEFSFNYLDQ